MSGAHRESPEGQLGGISANKAEMVALPRRGAGCSQRGPPGRHRLLLRFTPCERADECHGGGLKKIVLEPEETEGRKLRLKAGGPLDSRHSLAERRPGLKTSMGAVRDEK